jgi:hypothetical protein
MAGVGRADVSIYRDSLGPGAREQYDAAIAAAARVYANACLERERLAVTEGATAVARAAHYPGHPLTVSELQQKYQQMQAAARHGQAA